MGLQTRRIHFFNDFDPPADLAKIAESAGGALCSNSKRPK